MHTKGLSGDSLCRDMEESTFSDNFLACMNLLRKQCAYMPQTETKRDEKASERCSLWRVATHITAAAVRDYTFRRIADMTSRYTPFSSVNGR